VKASRWLMSGGEDNSVFIHPVNAQSLLDLACATSGRTLSEIERGRLGDVRFSDVCKAVVSDDSPTPRFEPFYQAAARFSVLRAIVHDFQVDWTRTS
jgi:hypothetical protein